MKVEKSGRRTSGAKEKGKQADRQADGQALKVDRYMDSRIGDGERGRIPPFGRLILRYRHRYRYK